MTSTDTARQGTAVYLDGQSNRKRNVELRFGASAIEIAEQGRLVATWPYLDCRHADGPPNVLRIGAVSALPLARLETSDPATQAAIHLHCTALDEARGRAQTLRIVMWSLAAVCSIVGIVMLGVPLAADRLAPFVPAAVENRIGDAVDQQVRALFGDRRCQSAAGHAAFTKLIEQISQAGGIEKTLDAHVLASGIPNAVALPGGRVYLMNGLLQKAQNPDEIAGVIAHELGHVRNRDNIRKIIQTGGTSFLIGLLLGDVVGGGAVIFVARSIVDASYSRDQERGADDFSVGVMRKLGRSPKAMGELLVRVTGAEKSRGFSILSSHPLSEERLATMSQQEPQSLGPGLLTDSEWRALKSICSTR